MAGETLREAEGNWDRILTEIGVPRDHLDGKHRPCPACGGEDRFRFESSADGSFFCNGACGPGFGIQLVQNVLGCDFKQAAQHIDSILGIDTTRKDSFTNENKYEGNRRFLRGIYHESRCLTGNDPATIYLEERGVLPPHKGLYYHPNLQYPIRGPVQARYPAMLGLVQDKNGNALTYHVTYIHNGQKAPVDRPKMVAPPVTANMSGGGVRLGGGTRNVVVAEGIETTLSGMLMWGLAGIAALNAGMMKKVGIPDGIIGMTILADNDHHYEGHAAAYALANRAAKAGIDAEVFIPPEIGEDWLDYMNRERRING